MEAFKEESAKGEAAGGGALDEVIELTRARARFYRLLGSFYLKELSAEGIENLSASGLDELSLGNAEADAGLAEMAAYLRRRPRNARQELACDFAGAILGAGSYEERRATPFESVFTSESGLLMQEARDDVYRFYCESHVGVDSSLQTPEDHLSFECEFMATLAERAVDAACSGEVAHALELVRTQQEFHAAHLANWVGSYCDCLLECALTRFYRGVAKLTRGFVAEDAAMLADTVAALEERAA